MIATFLVERPSEIPQNVYRPSRLQSGQQQVPSPAITRDYVLEDIRTLRFFTGVSARGDASPGHFYADKLLRVSGIQIETIPLSTQ